MTELAFSVGGSQGKDNACFELVATSNDSFPPVGGRMPVGGQLSQSQIVTIRDWLLQGALNN